jgi:membrane protease YdiL (CAAX protease family)
MNIKSVSGYILLLIISFIVYSLRPAHISYFSILPLFMVLYPVFVGHRIKFAFSINALLLGLLVSVFILFPYYLIFGGEAEKISAYAILFQLMGVALPEEFFFRGFLQDSIGKTLKAVLIVSILFSLAHLPKAIFNQEWMSLLSFFPSLIMGWLYMKTNNILPGTVFHLLANVVHSIIVSS